MAERFERGQRVRVVASSIQRSAGAAWRGDVVVVVAYHSPWIGPDTYDVRTGSGELLEGVPADDLGE